MLTPPTLLCLDLVWAAGPGRDRLEDLWVLISMLQLLLLLKLLLPDEDLVTEVLPDPLRDLTLVFMLVLLPDLVLVVFLCLDLDLPVRESYEAEEDSETSQLSSMLSGKTSSSSMSPFFLGLFSLKQIQYMWTICDFYLGIFLFFVELP